MLWGEDAGANNDSLIRQFDRGGCARCPLLALYVKGPCVRDEKHDDIGGGERKRGLGIHPNIVSS